MSNPKMWDEKPQANVLDEILDRITQDGRYSSAKEFSILFVESQDTLGGLSPIQFRKAKAKQAIEALITEARVGVTNQWFQYMIDEVGYEKAKQYKDTVDYMIEQLKENK